MAASFVARHPRIDATVAVAHSKSLPGRVRGFLMPSSYAWPAIVIDIKPPPEIPA